MKRSHSEAFVGCIKITLLAYLIISNYRLILEYFSKEKLSCIPGIAYQVKIQMKHGKPTTSFRLRKALELLVYMPPKLADEEE
jgi:hypothetical protein